MDAFLGEGHKEEMEEYISVKDFAKRYNIKEKTVKKRLDSIPGIVVEGGLYFIKDSARYPADKRWFKASDSAGKRYELLKAISRYRYVDYKMLSVSRQSFNTMLNQLISAEIIEENGSNNSDGANSYDCTYKGDKLLKEKKKEGIRLLSECLGIISGEIINRISNGG